MRIAFQLTRSCKQSCLFCYNKQGTYGKNVELPFNKYYVFLEKFKNLNIAEISLIGFGETLLYSDIEKFLKYLSGFDCLKTLTTNGLLLDRYAQTVADSIDQLNISIHGPENIHNKIVGRDSFNQAIGGLKKVRCFNPNVKIVINTVPCKENYRQIVDLVKYFLRYKNIKHSFMHLQNTGSSHPADDFNLEMANELFNVFEEVKKYNSQISHVPNVSVKIFKDFYYKKEVLDSLMNLLNVTCQNIEDDYLLITPEGDVMLGCVKVFHIEDNVDIDFLMQKYKKILQLQIENNFSQKKQCVKCCDFAIK